MNRGQLRLLLLAAFAGTGCIYSFNNPVQQQPYGSIAGQVQLMNAAAGQTTQDGGVAVAFTGGLSVRLDETGRFTFLALPDGAYSLQIFIPALMANDFPLVTDRAGVVLFGGGGAAVDALNLGALTVQPSGLVTGTVSNNQGLAAAVVAAFAPGTDGGLGTYEGYSAATDAGAYAFYLPAGNHILVSSIASLSSPLAPITLQARQTLDQTFYLDAGTGGFGQGQIEGFLVFGGRDGGANAPLESILPMLAAIEFVAFDPAGNPVADGGLFAPPITSASFYLSLPAGSPLDLEFLLPDTVNPAGVNHFDPLVLRALPSLADQTASLGQVTWLPVSTFLANAPDAGDSGVTATSGTTGTGGTAGSAGNTTSGGTGGSTTGGTTGGPTTGGTGGMGTWMLINSLNLADGGPPSIYGVVPLPLPGGAHRLAWADDNNVYYADDPGMFGPPIALADAGGLGPYRDLSAATTDAGSLIAWASISGVQAAFVPNQGGVFTPITISPPVSGYPAYQGLATFSGSLGGTPGTFILAPEFGGGIAVLFTSDNQSAQHFTVSVDLGNGPIFVNTVAGSACNITDFPTGVGFCFAGSGGSPIVVDGGTTMGNGVVFAGSVATSTATPSLLNVQKLLALPPGATEAVVALGAVPNGATDVVYVTAGNSVPSQSASFTGLATAPAMQPLGDGTSQIQLLLPWAGQAVGFSLVEALAAQVAPLFVPSGASAGSILPGVLAGYGAGTFGILNGYNDPATGDPVIGVLGADGGTLFIWQLGGGGPTPDAGTKADAGLFPDAGWFVADTIPLGDGGKMLGSVPLPITIGDGGWAHRVAWLQQVATGAYNLEVADDLSGMFGQAQTLTPTPIVPNSLVGVADPFGHNLIGFGVSGSQYSIYLPAGGPVTSAPIQADAYMNRCYSAVYTSLGSTPGFALIGTSVTSGQNIHIAFTTDGGSFTPFDIAIPDDAGSDTYGFFQAAPCGITDLAGDAGLCIVGEEQIGAASSGSAVFVGAISMAGTMPALVGYQIVYGGPDGGLGLPSLMVDTSTPTQVTVAFYDGVASAGGPSTFYYTQFTSLAQPLPSPTVLPQSGSYEGPSLLLPWRGGPLAVFDLVLTTGNVLRSLGLPPGTATAPPDVVWPQGSPVGYVDPQTGSLIMTSGNVLTTQLDLWELAP
jgi:hypothetical protein